jgi:S-adenosylmethionine hydrolase
VAGVIVAVERFGNLISNIESSAVVALAMPTVHIGGLALPLKRTYGDAKPGEYLGVINSFEVLEVAQSRGNAAKGLNLACRGAYFGRSGGPGPPIPAGLITGANRL